MQNLVIIHYESCGKIWTLQGFPNILWNCNHWEMRVLLNIWIGYSASSFQIPETTRKVLWVNKHKSCFIWVLQLPSGTSLTCSESIESTVAASDILLIKWYRQLVYGTDHRYRSEVATNSLIVIDQAVFLKLHEFPALSIIVWDR